MKKLIPIILGAFLMALAPLLASAAHPPVVLYDTQGNRIIDQLNDADTTTAVSGAVYKQGPAYSPKQTCGKCHDYNSITKAYHFREGTTPGVNGGISDTWVSENKDNNLQKYLTHAYGHLLSPGQFGAW
ncbi:MAG: hypothetical protein JXR80_05020 [Deltaproteobacteria bacterium]|nr:hypothetical protein [Deltaproteobacteria bacterium]